ncbi:MAG: HAD family phosphatase [Candidatus Liptonbacteria bacterium]|nr:HAD family phosphatase [Candidatus Liptonbacteria bacterium]
MIKGIAFDMEGTVIDLEAAHHEGHIRAAKDVGVTLKLEGALSSVPGFIGGPDSAVAEGIYELSNKVHSADFILSRTRHHYSELRETMRIEVRPGFEDALRELRGGECFPTAIGSLTPRRFAELLIRKSGLGKLFKPAQIVLKEDVRREKPAPDVFLETAPRMGIHPTEQLVFEDSPNGIRAAVAAGSIPIGMPTYNRPEVVTQLVNAGARRIFFYWDEMNVGALVANLDRE